MDRKKLRIIALGLLTVLVVGACGQKPNVLPEIQELASRGELSVDSEGNLVDAEGNVVGDQGDLAAAGIDPSSLSTGDPSSSLGGPSATGPGSSDPADSNNQSGDPNDPGNGTNPNPKNTQNPKKKGGGGPGPQTGGNAAGVEGDTIRIGGHAPVTGAAPVPASSFAKGQALYWDYIGNGINGRKVQSYFENDNFNPSTAVTKCQELVEDKKVFLLVGIAGADQIFACARYAESVGVPYLSGGVMESSVSAYRTYSAVWMSYAQQAPLLVDMMTSTLGAKGEKNGMVRFNTPGFTDGHDAFLRAMSRAGAKVSYDRAVPKTAGQTDAQSVATELSTQQIENVYVLTSPTFFIQLAAQTSQQNYFPQFVGVGLTMTIDTVASAACKNRNSIDGAKFFSPMPAYANADQFDPAFRKAGGTDDIMFGLWGVSKVVAALLKKPGKDLTRERFLYYTDRVKGLRTGVAPEVSFSSPGDNFGGTAMHLNEADCGTSRWVTIKPNAKSF